MTQYGFKSTQEQIQVEAPSSQLVLPYQFVGELTKESTTPSVKNITRCKFTNLTIVDVTNFKDGQEGQEIIVLGDGNTSVVEGDFISPGGGTHLLEPLYLYRFVLLDGKWIEFNYGGTSATTGGGSGGTTGLEGPPGADGMDGATGATGATGESGLAVPTLITGGDTFTVPVNRQMLFTIPIIIDDGALLIDGVLAEVD